MTAPDKMTFNSTNEQPGGPTTPVGDHADPNKTATFRERRLTKQFEEESGNADQCGQGEPAPRPAPLASSSFSHRGRRRSRELVEKVAVHNEGPLFPASTEARRVLGTYSCSGMEPGAGGAPETKINQDVGGVCYPFGGRADQALLCVLDGHGTDGEKVSLCAMEAMVEHIEQHAQLDAAPAKALADSFEAAQSALLAGVENATMDTTGDPLHSGATALALLLRGQTEMWIASAGDCRAVVGVAVHDGDGVLQPSKVEALDLNDEHKPDLEGELQRIEGKGGFVRPGYKDKDGFAHPARVYSSATARGPGLALSRSLGDVLAQSCGLTHEAHVEHIRLGTTEEARPELLPRLVGDRHEMRVEMCAAGDALFLILGSDGLWELLPSQDAADEVLRYYRDGRSAGEACERLISIATKAWKEEEGDYRDDITCIVLYLPCFADADGAAPTAPAACEVAAAATPVAPAAAPAAAAAAPKPAPAAAAPSPALPPAPAENGVKEAPTKPAPDPVKVTPAAELAEDGVASAGCGCFGGAKKRSKKVAPAPPGG